LLGQDAKCVLALHSDSWLHGDLRSSSLIFEGKDSINYRSFYLSGFGSLRPIISNYPHAQIPPNSEEIVFLHPAIDISDDGLGPYKYWRNSDIYTFRRWLVRELLILAISSTGIGNVYWRRKI
jgi:hypothetical protein